VLADDADVPRDVGGHPAGVCKSNTSNPNHSSGPTTIGIKVLKNDTFFVQHICVHMFTDNIPLSQLHELKRVIHSLEG